MRSNADAIEPDGTPNEIGSPCSTAICSSTVASITLNGTPNSFSSASAWTGAVPGVTATTTAGTGSPPSGYL